MSNCYGDTCDSDDFALKLRKLRANPSEGLDSLRNEFSEFSESFTKRNYQYIALVVAMHYKICASEALRQDILDGLQIKKHANKIKDKSWLLLVFRFFLRAPKKGPVYERARIYAGAMRDAVLNETDPEDIPTLIRDADGIEELYAQRKLKENGRKSALMRRDQGPSSVHLSGGDSEQGDYDAKDHDDDDDDDVKRIVTRGGIKGGSAPRIHASVSSSPWKSERERKGEPLLFNKKKDLAVTFPSPEELYDLLASQATGGSMEFRLGDIGDKPRKVFMIQCTLNG